MAYAAAAFAESCLRAMAGESGVTEYAYVESSVGGDGVPFFASGVSLDTSGATPDTELGPMNDAERRGLDVRFTSCWMFVVFTMIICCPVISRIRATPDAELGSMDGTAGGGRPFLLCFLYYACVLYRTPPENRPRHRAAGDGRRRAPNAGSRVWMHSCFRVGFYLSDEVKISEVRLSMQRCLMGAQ